MKINILLENNRIDSQYKSKHGLSILIKHKNKNVPLDVGPDNKFIENAKKMNLDLENVEMLFLSHSHYDHTKGLNSFFKFNKKADVYLMDKIKNSYYLKTKLFNIPIGISIHKRYHSRIIELNDDLKIDNYIYFVKNIINVYEKPTSNNVLFKKEGKKLINDTFDHEGTLVLEENNELIIFNSCSHNGLLNIIENIERNFPNKKIKSYVGGLHLSNPRTKKHESREYLDFLIKNINIKNIVIYTGHCTGKYAYDYLKNGLKDKIQEINTGMELNI